MTEQLRSQGRVGRWTMAGVAVVLGVGVAAAAELTLKGAVHTEGSATSAAVRVVSDRGEPVDGARVAAGEAPLGAAALTDGEGRASVHVPARGQWSVVALSPPLAGRTVRRGSPPEGGVELELAPAEEVEVRWSGARGQAAVLPTWLPEALTGGAARVVGGGRAHLPLAGAVRGGLGAFGRRLLLWAPGFQAAEAGVAESAEPVEVALKPAGTLAVRVTDSAARPRSGVPVWAWVPEERPAFMVVRGLLGEPPKRRWLPEGVSDGAGAAVLAGLPPGNVRASARAPGFPEAASSPVELAAGQRRELTLVLASGVSLACTVNDAQGCLSRGRGWKCFAGRRSAGARAFPSAATTGRSPTCSPAPPPTARAARWRLPFPRDRCACGSPSPATPPPGWTPRWASREVRWGRWFWRPE